MPEVRTYGPRRVESSPLPGVRRQSVDPTGEGIANLGRQVAGFALGGLEQRWADARRRANAVKIRDAELSLATFEVRRREDRDTGWLTRKGANADGLSDQVLEEYQAEADRIRGTLSTPEQLDAFEKSVAVRRVQLLEWSEEYEGRELEIHDAQQHAKFVDTATQNAIAHADDLERVGAELEAAVVETEDWGERNGRARVEIDAQRLIVTSTIHTGVIEKYLANGKSKAAAVYYEGVKDEIRGERHATIEKALSEGNTRQESQKAADEIFRTVSSQQDAIDRARAIEDPDLRDATEDRLVQMFQRGKQAEHDALETTMTAAANLIDQGGLDAVPVTLWQALPIGARGNLTSYAKAVANGGDVETDLVEYYRLRQMALTNPASFAKLNLGESLSKIARVEFKELVELQLDLRKGNKPKADAALDDDRTRGQILTSAYDLYGIDHRAAAKPEQKALVARIDRMVAARQNEYQRLTGKKAPQADVQRFVDDILTTEITTPGRRGAWTNILPGGAPFFDQPATSRRLVDTKIGDVPASERSKIEAALRSRGMLVNDEMILQTYIDGQIAAGRRR